MPDVHIQDVDEAADFYFALRKFNNGLNEWFQFIWPRLVALGGNWRDPQYDRLYETLDENLRNGIKEYEQVSDDVALELRRQVNHILELLGRPTIN